MSDFTDALKKKEIRAAEIAKARADGRVPDYAKGTPQEKKRELIAKAEERAKMAPTVDKTISDKTKRADARLKAR